MNRKISRVRFIFLIVAFLLMLFFTNIYCTQSLGSGLEQPQYDVTQRQVSENTVSVIVWVFLSGDYKFFDINVQNEVLVNITTYLTAPPERTYVISAVIPFSLTEVAGLEFIEGAYYTYGFWGSPPVATLNIYLPANTSYSSISLRGSLSTGSSVFWKTSAEIFLPKIEVSPIMYTYSSVLILVPPSASKVLKVHSYANPNFRHQEATIEGKRCIVVSEINPGSSVVTMYEPKAWEPYALALMVVTIFMVYVVPYTLKSKKNRGTLSKFISSFRKLFPPKLIGIIKGLANFIMRLKDKILKLDSAKLLTAYILCALLMISLSLAVGPDPRKKVYVLAATSETAEDIIDFVSTQGATAVYGEMGEFKLLIDLGVFDAVIVGDFIPPTEKIAKNRIYPALDIGPNIIILQPYTSFSLKIEERYPEKTVVVGDLTDLGPVLYRIPKRANALGLSVGPSTYIGVSAFIGLFSFIIYFFGMAFLACKLIETGRKPGVRGFPEAIAYSLFVFFFTQVIYIVCSVLLALPLGLHTAKHKITAVSFLGFGGGSRPRMLSGLVGFLFGSLLSLKGGPKLDKTGFAAFMLITFFIIVDPLTSGIIFYEFVLLFTSPGPAFGTVFVSVSYIKDFLSFIGDIFGGWISPTYGLSTGIILFYAGAMPICLFAKLKKSTAVVLLFFCAFCAANGGIRVADMMPWKSVASFVPGVMVGLFFAAIFCLISLAEGVIRAKIGKRGIV